MAKPRKPLFPGKLIILIDSRSASASEVFARVMQLEKRGTVLGDLSAGAVMEAEIHPHHEGFARVAYFGTEITRANLLMTDGKSLENMGVLPDTKDLPSAEDLRENRDPVLAHALEMLGQKISPENAGKFFPPPWRED